MSSIITPVQYKTAKWKNGKGQTTEMAIDPNGNLDCFEWRISQAKVTEDGEFSDFAGYQRHMVLLKGNGLTLEHDEVMSDDLDGPLSIAAFDGSCKTVGKLKGGAIINFNLITRASHFEVSVETYKTRTEVVLPQNQHCFVFSYNNEVLVEPGDIRLPAAHLLEVTEEDNIGLSVIGEQMIVACIKRLDFLDE